MTTYRHHLMADGREVAEIDLSNSGSSVVEKISYILSDHLGSVDVVTDQTGTPIAQMSFGAFGNRREPGTWLPPVGSAEAQSDHNADRYGFTHQEMLDNVALIHMNGRVYDPNLGRFLSVDPVFEFPTNTQSLNPYSYVLNNPLSMTDPTGYVSTCGTGKASCPDSESGSVTVKTTAHELGSHIATHGMTTITLTKEANGNTVMSASGNGFGLGQTAEVTVDSHGGGNGAQNTQSVTSAQQQPATHTDIGSPALAQVNAATNSNMNRSTQTVAPCADIDCRLQTEDTDKIPNRMVIEPSKTEKHGAYSYVYYKLVNVRGKILTGNGYGVEEHLWKNKAATQHMDIAGNSENQFVPVTDGEVRDQIGYGKYAPSETSFTLYQTFSISYPGGPQGGIPLSTEFEHITTVDKQNDTVTNTVVDIIP